VTKRGGGGPHSTGGPGGGGGKRRRKRRGERGSPQSARRGLREPILEGEGKGRGERNDF